MLRRNSWGYWGGGWPNYMQGMATINLEQLLESCWSMAVDDFRRVGARLFPVLFTISVDINN